MSVAQVEINDIKIKGPFPGKYGEFIVQEYHTTGGIFTKSAKPDADTLANVNDTVTVDFTTTTKTVNGKEYDNNQIKSMLVVVQTDRPTTTPGSEKAVKSVNKGLEDSKTGQTKTRLEKTKEPETQLPFNAFRERDVSMEVSGLLQALIQTGRHFNKEGQLDVDHLETDLKSVLDLKRSTAKDYL